ncbi:MAG TPA: DUF983 domain-containing protein [Pyrinomonadaceae bacterium]
MKKNRRPVIRTLLRSIGLRCPVCGKSSIVQRPFKIKHHCPACDALFMREEGFFVGAILINVVTTEIVILAIYLLTLVVLGLDYQLVLTLLFISALLFPIAFYHHSWSIWLGFDHIVESLPKRTEKEPARAGGEDEWPDEIGP